MADWRQLREKFPGFYYRDYSWEIKGKTLEVKFIFEIPGLAVFTPEITVQPSKGFISNPDKGIIDNLVFHAGLAEIPSYWKATVSPNIFIECGSFTREQELFWRNLFLVGMGQFYFENNIDFTKADFLLFAYPTVGSISLIPLAPAGKGDLVAISGGKDSIVAAELLRRNNVEFSALVANILRTSLSALRVVRRLGVGDIQVTRPIDQQLLRLNGEGFLNGHTPIVAYLSFVSILCAYLGGFNQVVFSNEISSDEGNGEYLDMEINHQYDKSTNFENLFREYNRRFLSGINYFSFLRPIHELQTMKMFAKMEGYFSDFRSCNVGSKTDSWCGKCPKCLAVYVGLRPFVAKEKLLAIFGYDLLGNKSLLPVAAGMLGMTGNKPLECVGTLKETLVAFYLCAKKETSDLALLSYFRKEVLQKFPDIERQTDEILRAWNERHNLPGTYEKILKIAYENS